MKGEHAAMKIFELIKKDKMLPSKIEELVPLSFIGQAAVTFMRQKVKLMDQLKMTDEQRKATLADGQDAGEILLTIEDRIGEIAAAETRANVKAVPIKGPKGALIGSKNKPSGKPPKHERLGMDKTRMKQSQQIFKNRDVVERVKAQAKANDDIPTRTAVISEIKREKALKALKTVKEKQRKEKILKQKKPPSIDKYLNEVQKAMDDSRSKLAVLEGKIQYIESKLNRETFKNSLDALIDIAGRIRKEL